MSNSTGKFVAIALIVAAIVYTLFIGFVVVFTIAFFGVEDFGADLYGSAIFVVVAISPLPLWWYCLTRAAAWRHGERPPL